MTEAIIVAIITGLFAFSGTALTNLLSHSKTIYRIEQLEKKVEKHNNLVERMYTCEGDIATCKTDIKENDKNISECKKSLTQCVQDIFKIKTEMGAKTNG